MVARLPDPLESVGGSRQDEVQCVCCEFLSVL